MSRLHVQSSDLVTPAWCALLTFSGEVSANNKSTVTPDGNEATQLLNSLCVHFDLLLLDFGNCCSAL